MDLSAILPLLLLGGRQKAGEKVSADLISSLVGGKNGTSQDMLGAVLKSKSGSPEMAAALSSMLAGKKNRTPAPRGLTPLLGFISDDILGKLTKYFSSTERKR